MGDMRCWPFWVSCAAAAGPLFDTLCMTVAARADLSAFDKMDAAIALFNEVPSSAVMDGTALSCE